MQSLLRVLYIMVLALLSFFSHASEKATVLASATDAVDVRPFIYRYTGQDPIGFEQAISEEYAQEFLPFDGAIRRSQEEWFRFTVQAPEVLDQPLVLEFPFPLYEFIDLYYMRDGQWQVFKTGARFPYLDRPIKGRFFAFPLHLKPAQQYDVYIRIQSKNVSIVRAKLIPALTYPRFAEFESRTNFIPAAALITACIYTFILFGLGFSKLKLSIFILYLLSAVNLDVYTLQFWFEILPDKPDYHQRMWNYVLIAFNFISLLFPIIFFDLHKKIPWLAKSISVLLVPIFLYTFYVSFNYDQPNIAGVSQLISQVTLFTLIFTAVVVAIHRIEGSFYYLIGTILYSILIGMQIMTFMGVIPPSDIARTAGNSAVVVLFTFLSFSLFRQAAKAIAGQALMEKKVAVAEAQAKARSNFLATMSHEIRTPINGVVGTAQLLQKTQLTDEQQSYIDTLVYAGDSLNVVVNDILDLARIESGKLKIEHVTFDLDNLLDYFRALYESEAQKKGLSFSVSADEDIPKLLIGDRNRLQQVISNLLSNAFKFTRNGSINLSCSLEKQLSSDRIILRFSVQDTGIGFDLGKKEKLFEPYEQADSSTSRQYGGTGLGLSICHRLIIAMEGNIDANSEAGKGANFWFEIPLDISTEKAVTDSPVLTEQMIADLRDKRILVAEDNPVNLKVIQAALSNNGIQSDFAVNGQEAIGLFKKKPNYYSLILMDCEMPIVDGFTATKTIRNIERERALMPVPIVALTAHAFDENKSRCLQAGMNEVLTKPILFDKLMFTLYQFTIDSAE